METRIPAMSMEQSSETLSVKRASGWVLFSALVAALAAGSAAPAAEGIDPEQVKFFEAEVRPVLAENCWKCHGPQKQKGGLRLDSRAAVLQGGESGPAIVEGKPEESLLVEAINH